MKKNERTISTKLERPVRNTRIWYIHWNSGTDLLPIYEGENVLGISPTGTGKTLAYLFPSLLKLKPKKAQQLLILAPNTELAGQIFDVTKQWAEPLGLQTQLFLSGSSQKRQIERLKKGPEILVGTPGRIFELIKLKKIKMMNVETIILDEFDQLLSDSQYHFVDKISHYAPRDHQYIYMSATAKVDPDQLEENTLRMTVDGVSLDNIQHFYMQVDKRDKVELLRKLAYVEDFRGLAFSTVYLIWVVLKKNYNTVVLRPCRWPAMSMSNTARSFWNASKTIS